MCYLINVNSLQAESWWPQNDDIYPTILINKCSDTLFEKRVAVTTKNLKFQVAFHFFFFFSEPYVTYVRLVSFGLHTGTNAAATLPLS